MKLPKGNYYTVQEMADLEGQPIKTISQRLFRAYLKPVSKDALYDQAAYDFIKSTRPPGRPKKPKP